MKYLRSTTFGFKDIVIRKSEFVAKTQFLCFELWIILKNMKVGFCLENATMFQIQDMFGNGKPDIVLKTVKRFNIIRSLIIILIFKSLKLGIVYLVMFKKMLVSFYYRLLLWI